MKNRFSAGFTLIELLMVVAIIALLASMLLPVVGMVRTASKKMVCANNLRQISLAFGVYMMDNKGYIPYGYKYISPWDPWYAQALVNMEIFPDITSWVNEPKRSLSQPGRPFPGKLRPIVCPSRDSWFLDKSDNWACTNYAANMGVMQLLTNGTEWSAPAHRPSYFKDQSRILLVADGWLDPGTNSGYNIYNSNGVTFSSPWCVLDLRHGNAANGLYLDGHIDTLRASSTFITDFN